MSRQSRDDPGCLPLAGLAILIVESDALVRLDLEDTLADLGANVAVSAVSVGRALDLLATDAVVIDCALIENVQHGADREALPTLLRQRGVPFGWIGAATAQMDDGSPVLSKPFSNLTVLDLFQRLMKP